MSLENQNPVRVVRGSGVDSKWAPYTGYRYDGLYVVTDVCTIRPHKCVIC